MSIGMGQNVVERQSPEAQLRRVEAEYRALVERIPAVIYIAAADEVGSTLYVSPQVETVLGFAVGEWVGRPHLWADQLHPDDRDRVLGEYARARTQGEPFRCEYRLQTRDGRVRWFRDEANLSREASGRPLFYQGVLFDITERKRAEDAAQESRRRLQALFDTTLDSIVLADDHARYVDVNPAACALLGYSREELLRMEGFDVTPEAMRASSRAEWQTFLARGELSGEYEILRKDGTTRTVEFRAVANVLPGLHLAAMRDVTERRRAEGELRRSQARLAEAQRLAHVGSWEWNVSTGAVTYSDELYRILGLTPGEPLTVERLSGFVHPDDLERVARQSEEAVRDGKPLVHFLRMVRRDGAVRTLHSCATCVLDEAGRVVRVVGTAQDVTEQRQAQEALERQLEELRVLHAVAAAGADAVDEDALIDRVTRILADKLYPNHERLGALLVDEAAGALRVHPSYQAPADEKRFSALALGQGITGRVAQDGQPRRVGDVSQSPEFVRVAPHTRSALCVPLKAGERVLGVIHVESNRPNAFGPEDERLLLTVAGQLATAIERARLFAAEHRQTAELTRSNRLIAALSRVAAHVEGKPDLDAMLATLGDELHGLGVECCVALRQPHAPALALRYISIGQPVLSQAEESVGLTMDDVQLSRERFTLFDDLVERQRALFIRDPMPVLKVLLPETPEPSINHMLQLIGLSVGTPAIYLPLVVEEQALGALILWGERLLESDLPAATVFAGQVATAIENARLFRQVRDGREQLRALSRRLLDVQEAERRAIARELHDEIGQALTGLKLSLDMGARLPAGAARTHLREAETVIQELIGRVRELSLDLRPAMLDDLGLLPALLWHIERYTAQTRVRVSFQHAGLERRFPPQVETAAYRIVQEALTNVARHAGVDHATVRLDVESNALWVYIGDEGQGFDAEAGPAAPESSGLAGMRERASLLGGRLTVQSNPGSGVCLAAELPIGD